MNQPLRLSNKLFQGSGYVALEYTRPEFTQTELFDASTSIEGEIDLTLW